MLEYLRHLNDIAALHTDQTRRYPAAVCDFGRHFDPDEWTEVVRAMMTRCETGVRAARAVLTSAARALETNSVFPRNGCHADDRRLAAIAMKLRRVIQDHPGDATAFAAYCSTNVPPTDKEIREAKWERKHQTAQQRMDCAEWQKSTLTELGYSGEWPPTWAEANALIGALVAAREVEHE